MVAKTIVLASGSAQRKALLQQIGIDPLCVAADIDETRLSNESAQVYVQRLAVEKCQTILQQYPDAIVIGADTAIAAGDQVFGKAAGVDQALATLSRLSDSQHSVVTGVAVATGAETRDCVCETKVDFKPISGEEILAYWNTGEPQGKAGCYAIQGMGAIFVKSLHGSYTNVVGLPLYEMAELLRYFGLPVLK